MTSLVMNGSWKYTPSLWVSSPLPFLLALERYRKGNVKTKHNHTCFFYCIKYFPILSSVLQLKKTFHIQAFPLPQLYLLGFLPHSELFHPMKNFSPTVHPNIPCNFKLYARCFSCLEGASRPYSTKVLLVLYYKYHWIWSTPPSAFWWSTAICTSIAPCPQFA